MDFDNRYFGRRPNVDFKAEANKFNPNGIKLLEDNEVKLNEADMEELDNMQRQDFGRVGFGGMNSGSVNFRGSEFGSRGVGRPLEVEYKAEADEFLSQCYEQGKIKNCQDRG